MTYPLFPGAPSELAVTPPDVPVIGADIQFLLDTDAGFMVKTIKEIAETVEADAYYDEPGTCDTARFYVLTPGQPPREVADRYYVVQITGTIVYKRVAMVDTAGGVIAQAPYELHRDC